MSDHDGPPSGQLRLRLPCPGGLLTRGQGLSLPLVPVTSPVLHRPGSSILGQPGPAQGDPTDSQPHAGTSPCPALLGLPHPWALQAPRGSGTQDTSGPKPRGGAEMPPARPHPGLWLQCAAMGEPQPVHTLVPAYKAPAPSCPCSPQHCIQGSPGGSSLSQVRT